MRCAITNHEFEIPEIGRAICEALGAPLPSIRFEEGLRRQLVFRNLLNLFRRPCAKSGKSIISIFPPNSKLTVYDKDLWWGDSWDALAYGREFDFGRGFFEQFDDLVRVVPIFSLQNMKTENADYCNSVENVKQSYLAFVAYGGTQDAYFSYNTIHSKNQYYSLFTYDGELNFYDMRTYRCYQTVYVEESNGCRDCAFCFQMEECSHCLFCSNLRHKEYHLYNQPCSKEAFEEQMQALDLGSVAGFRRAQAEYARIRREAVHRATMVVNCEDSLGHHLNGSRNCVNAYEGINAENIAECLSFNDARNAYRVYGFGGEPDTIYNCTSIVRSQLCAFCMWAYYCFDCFYCINVHNCKDCFGCAGLRNKQYCIMNKQYSREAYFELRERIVEHMKRVPFDDAHFRVPVAEWGQWFPPQSAFYPYNTSFAATYLPLAKTEALAAGFEWDDSLDAPVTASTQEGNSFPDRIEQWEEHHAKCAFRCEKSGKLFNVVPPVIQAFKQANLALLPEHPIEYLRQRLSESRFRLMPRVSSKSGAPLLSVYSEAEAPLVFSNEEYREEFC